MPTRDRRQYVRQSVAYFLRQDYPNRSLVVVDDGYDPVEGLLRELLPADGPPLHYLRLTPGGGHTRGAKRNRGCLIVPDDALIAHWDDDDWMAPDRLSRQVRELVARDADLCAIWGAFHYRAASGQGWRDSADQICAPTIMYRKSSWSRAPLADRNGREEVPFVAAVPPGRTARMTASEIYIAVLHDGNTVGRNVTDATRWTPIDAPGRLLPLLAEDAPFYTGVRDRIARARGAALLHQPVGPAGTAARTPADVPAPARSSAHLSPITLIAPFLVYDGYGSLAEHLALGLADAGARVHLLPLMLDLAGTDPRLARMTRTSRPAPDAAVVYFCWPRSDLDGGPLAACRDLFINTMWEGTRLPAGWVERLERARAVIVPTAFVADVFRSSGVTRPIAVIPEGVHPDIYGYFDRPPRNGLTTLMVGPVAPRKNTLLGVAAWRQAFADDPEARLVLKARFGYSRFASDDPRIRLVDEDEPSRGIARWYTEADVLLALGSEGFGLPLVEGMATGLPVIALDAAGQSDTVRAAGAERVLAVPAADWVPFDDARPSSGGLRPVPDVAAVARQLRWVADHRDEARAMGRAASRWALSECDLRRKPAQVLDFMEEVTPTRLLRTAPTVWTPSKGGSCGIAEYAAHLAGALSVDGTGLPSRHTAKPPAVGAASVVHLQHEWSLFPDDAALTAFVHGARRAGVPVAVTEHSVLSSNQPARGWERAADLLVTLTGAGVSRLREHVSDRPSGRGEPCTGLGHDELAEGQRVVWVPPGCPTFFPPRKRSRGRVLASFGFLWPHKGFWKLLDLVRRERHAGGDTRLLLFSHALNPELAARWEQDADGLPVERVDAFLPVEQIASRLAAEADALVLWYDDILHYSASYAVRVALSTGVPVLCSPTSWFRDVATATYQPAGTADEDLASGIERLLLDDDLRTALSERARDYCHSHSWEVIARRHRELWSELAAGSRRHGRGC